MPLPAPATDRDLLHTRTIVCEGFARTDGLWDIDGWLTDVKTYDVPNQDRGGIPAGVPVHGMGLRMTINADLTIVDVIAVQDHTPFTLCPAITPSFRKLVGLNLGKGFRRRSREVLGGIQGCVHLVDLLEPMATTAYQTLAEPRYRGFQEAVRRGEAATVFFINSCHAWAEDGDLAKREFPGLRKPS